ncbi:MAG TPA: hypothetical protein VI279_02170 [Rhodocyclaceae bacterium]
MKRQTSSLAQALYASLLLLLSAPAWAKGGGHSGGSSPSSRTEHVSGYTRSDGTHVESYYRSRPGTLHSSPSSSAGDYTPSAAPAVTGGAANEAKVPPIPDETPPISGQHITVIRNREGEIIYMGNGTPPASILAKATGKRAKKNSKKGVHTQ